MGTILAFVIFIGLLVLSFKVTWFIIKLCGKFLGLFLSVIGYIIIGAIGLSLISIAIIVVPVVVLIAVISIFSALGSVL